MPAPLVMVLLVQAGLFPVRHDGPALTFFTPVVLQMMQHPGRPPGILIGRGLETVIEALAGITVAVTVRGPDHNPHRV